VGKYGMSENTPRRFDLIGPFDGEILYKNPKPLRIGIPAHNCEYRIGETITLLAKEIELIPRVELVVCASGCSDRTVDAAKNALYAVGKQVQTSLKTDVILSDCGEATALNAIVSYFGIPDRVVTINDDVVLSPNSLTALGVAMIQHPDLAAIALRDDPVAWNENWVHGLTYPTVRLWNAIAYLQGSEKRSFTARACGFNPQIISTIPAIHSVDLFVRYKALTHKESGGYGVVNGQGGRVMHRIPLSVVDLVEQKLKYSRMARQFYREIPDGRRVLNEGEPKSSRQFEMMLRLVDSDSGFDFPTRLAAFSIVLLCKVYGDFFDKFFPMNGLVRKRIATTV